MAKRNDIKLGTHGEDYGNWMSTPVFYVFGGLAALALILAVVSFALLQILKCYPESNKPAVS